GKLTCPRNWVHFKIGFTSNKGLSQLLELFPLFFLHCSLYSKVFKMQGFNLLHTGKFVPFQLVFELFCPSQSQFQKKFLSPLI
ncbi:hypothetical protein QLX55_10360, partial [Solobacterium moorei]|uniref:hypothetical protein n=1 Tax=Solobacterium moorei TaxID=102148 RepID=UPI0024AD5C6F